MARVLTAVVFLPILFIALWAQSPVWFAGLAMAGILIGLFEFYALTKQGGEIQGVIAAGLILAAFYLHRQELIPLLIAGLVIVELLVQLEANADKEDFSNVLTAASINVFGVLYTAFLGGYIIALRMIESPVPHMAAKLLTLFFIIVFAGDTAAYYTGRKFGRRKLAPHISPGKTVEGVIGGLLGSMGAAALAHFTFFPELNLEYAIPLALGMGAAGITGDLCESMIKRGAKAKDASKLIPGHGGLLDRLDSMLFNAPLLYYFYEVWMK
jgi:phosphatidate cytidylyltransferase